ncbi:hypothetical protein BV898_00651 [Hypsibius exemplaris]|uniref:Uncharacterized protein n=1 Tax=Hypsibius exemplaris TaxID=2072580 RepID=A0A1W0XEC5_HYPEX|nr:hypothetical protein BV898_00651 [Hypsibius exemplaris]
MCQRKHKVSVFLDVVGILMTAALIAVVVAFATPYWYVADLDTTTSLVTPYRLSFHSLGLWMLCYRVFPVVQRNVLWSYQTSCRYYVSTLKDDIELPDFFMATQGLFTIGVGLCIVGFVIHLLVLGLCYAVNKLVVVLLGFIFLLSALALSLALMVYGGRIDHIGTSIRDSEFVFGWSGNSYGWSFWLAVAGTCLLWVAVVGYFAELCRMAAPPPRRQPEEKTQIVTTVYYPSGQDFIPYTAV